MSNLFKIQSKEIDKFDLFDFANLIFKRKIFFIIVITISFLGGYIYFNYNIPEKNYTKKIIFSEHLSSVVESDIIDSASKRTLEMISRKYNEILFAEKLFSLYSQNFSEEILFAEKLFSLYSQNFFPQKFEENKYDMFTPLESSYSRKFNYDFNLFSNFVNISQNLYANGISKYQNNKHLSKYFEDDKKIKKIGYLINNSDIQLNNDKTVGLTLNTDEKFTAEEIDLLINFLSDLTLSTIYRDMSIFIMLTSKHIDNSSIFEESLKEEKIIASKKILENKKNDENSNKLQNNNESLSFDINSIYSSVSKESIKQISLKPLIDLKDILEKSIELEGLNDDPLMIFSSNFSTTKIKSNFFTKIKFSLMISFYAFVILCLLFFFINYRFINLKNDK